MTSSFIKPMLHGIVPPIITPLKADRELDLASLERLLEHVIAGGVHGLFILGTSAEWASLTENQRREIIRIAIQTSAGRVPVYAQVTSPCIADSLHLAHFAEMQGVNAIIVSAPYYMPLSQAEVLNYVDAMIAGQNLPLILYNYPGMTRTGYEVYTMQRIIERPRVIGMKDSSGDMQYLHQIITLAKDRSDFGVLSGTEIQMAPMVLAGAHGGVAGSGNVNPQLMVSLYKAAVARNEAETDRLQQQLAVLSVLYRMGGASSGIRGIKTALKMLGLIDTDLLTAPHNACSASEAKLVENAIRELAAMQHPARPQLQLHIGELAKNDPAKVRPLVANSQAV